MHAFCSVPTSFWQGKDTQTSPAPSRLSWYVWVVVGGARGDTARPRVCAGWGWGGAPCPFPLRYLHIKGGSLLLAGGW